MGANDVGGKGKTRKSGKGKGSKWTLKRILLLGGVAFVAFALFVVANLIYWSAGLPNIDSLNDYDPMRVTKIYSDDGHLVGELFRERRTVAPIDSIPEHVRQAFLAAEDANFYEHEGLDYFGILRAMIKNLRPGAHLQGASTITQQTVKTMVVGDERSYSRKMREALLTRKLEQILSKDDIFYLYLNQIYFGGGAYGVEEAAQLYFGKSVRELTLAEGAYLACAPKNPSRYTLRANPKAVKGRQEYVLTRMLENGWADKKAIEKAIAAPVMAAAPPPKYLRKVPHYVEQVRRLLLDKYDEEMVYEQGLTVYVGMNAVAQDSAQRALRQSLEDLGKKHGYPGAKVRVEVDKFEAFHKALGNRFAEIVEARSLSVVDEKKPILVWDLQYVSDANLDHEQRFAHAAEVIEFEPDGRAVGMVTVIDSARKDAYVDFGGVLARITLSSLKWARPFAPLARTKAPRDPSAVFRRGDLVAVAFQGKPDGKRNGKPVVPGLLIPRPMAEGAVVAIDPHSRMVRALVGGYEQKAGDLIRATQARRQPGSSFKPILYATALAQKEITAASICPDSPVVIRDEYTGKSWKPENYDGKYDGNITYRRALTLSKNTCSVKLIERVKPEVVIEQARKMGIKSDLPENLTLALGTGDITPMELANAYATIASGGAYAEPIFIRKIVNRRGEVLEENRAAPVEVMSPAAAYVVTQMMRSVIEEGTATRAKVLDRHLAGKTGTSQQSRNVWFSGFSPELVATVWVGFDDNKPMGRVYGGTVALPAWIRLMGRVLSDLPESEFPAPEEVVFVRVDKKTGLPSSSTDDADSLDEAFIAGTEPDEKTDELPSTFLIEDEEEGGPL